MEPDSPGTGRPSVDWINFEFYEGKVEGRKDNDEENVSRARQKDLLAMAPAIRMSYSIMGGRRSAHWFQTKKMYDAFQNQKIAERKAEEVCVDSSPLQQFK